MITTMYPYFGLVARWMIAALTMFVGAALAQEPTAIDCSGDDFVEGVNWDLADDGAGMAFALGGGAVHISCDDGATWTRQQHPNASGYALFVHPLDPAMIFVGSYSSGVYRSTDHGASFAAVSAGVIDEGVMSFAARPDGTLLAGAKSGIYKSDPSGKSWSLLTDVTAGFSVRAILVDPGNPNNIYVGTNGGGAYQSYDGGTSWLAMGPFSQVNVLQFEPGNTSHIIATAWDGIWHSVDSGASWQLSGGIRNSDFAFDPNNSAIAYRTSRLDGAHKSVDGGLTWVPVNEGLATVQNDMYAVHVLPSGTVIIGTEFGGVYRSDDAGASWSSTGDRTASNPGTGGGTGTGGGSTTSAVASLSININFRGDNGNVNAGKNVKFKVTIKNDGPDMSSATTVGFDWSHDVFLSSPHHLAYSMTTTQGSCVPTYSGPDCTFGSIPPGGSVVIEFSGSTEKGERHTFNLDVWADNAESGGSVFATKAIKTKVDSTTSCILIFCTTSKDSGGGAAGLWLLLLLGAASCRRALRPDSFAA